jgi:hypothetical protein
MVIDVQNVFGQRLTLAPRGQKILVVSDTTCASSPTSRSGGAGNIQAACTRNQLSPDKLGKRLGLQAFSGSLGIDDLDFDEI